MKHQVEGGEIDNKQRKKRKTGAEKKEQMINKAKQEQAAADETLARRSGALCSGVVSGCSLPFCTGKQTKRKQVNKQTAI